MYVAEKRKEYNQQTHTFIRNAVYFIRFFTSTELCGIFFSQCALRIVHLCFKYKDWPF